VAPSSRFATAVGLAFALTPIVGIDSSSNRTADQLSGMVLAYGRAASGGGGGSGSVTRVRAGAWASGANAATPAYVTTQAGDISYMEVHNKPDTVTPATPSGSPSSPPSPAAAAPRAPTPGRLGSRSTCGIVCWARAVRCGQDASRSSRWRPVVFGRSAGRVMSQDTGLAAAVTGGHRGRGPG
jgi:hypothetical protein